MVDAHCLPDEDEQAPYIGGSCLIGVLKSGLGLGFVIFVPYTVISNHGLE